MARPRALNPAETQRIVDHLIAAGEHEAAYHIAELYNQLNTLREGSRRRKALSQARANERKRIAKMTDGELLKERYPTE